MYEFGGLWKHKKRTQHALKVSISKMLKLDLIWREKEHTETVLC